MSDCGHGDFYEMDNLRSDLAEVVERLLAAHRGDDLCQTHPARFGSRWFVRLQRLRPRSPSAPADGAAYALIIERARDQKELSEAVRRYSLSQRESEVLGRILRGEKASEISSALNIAAGTVQGYYKRLLSKTDTRNRAAMVAKVLGWEAQHPLLRGDSLR